MLIQQIKIAFDQAGIGIPFPMRTVNIDYDQEFQAFTKDLRKEEKIMQEDPKTKTTLKQLDKMVNSLQQKVEHNHFSHETLKEEIKDEVNKVHEYEKKDNTAFSKFHETERINL